MKRLVILGCVVLTACSATPRALSGPESARLANVRVAAHQVRLAAVDVRVPTAGGVLRLDGRVDFVARIGYASLTTEGRSDAEAGGLLQWSPALLAFREGPAPSGLPADGWQYRPLQQGAELDTVLTLLTTFGATQPENVQDTARWLRKDSVGETTVDVFDNGGRLTYWVDTAGALRRLDARLGDRTEPATITFTPGAAPFETLPDLR